MIPKIIHQTYSVNNVPNEFFAGINKLKQLNSNWEYRFYNDSDIEYFLKSEYPINYYDSYHKINPEYGPARADFFRYLLIYKYGGVYLDIKSTVNKSLDSTILNDDEYVLSYWKNNKYEKYAGVGMHDELVRAGFIHGEFQNWHIICSAHNPMMKVVIDSMMQKIKESKYLSGKYGVLITTGPIMYTKALGKVLANYPNRIVSSNDDLGLIYSSVKNHKKCFQNHYSTIKSKIILN